MWRLACVLAAVLLISGGAARQSLAGPFDEASPASARAATTFECNDSLPRGDGSRRLGTCEIRRQYCYEATGGPAVSHGAHCRALPRSDATCADLTGPSGTSCTGTPDTGLHVHFAFP